MTEDLARRARRRPGFGSALASVAFLALLAGNRYEWWDYRPPWDVFLDLLIVWLSVAGLLVVGVVWIWRSVRYRNDCRRWPLPSAVAPLLVLATAVAFIVMEKPVDRDFDRARTQMEVLATSMLDDRAERLGPTEITGVKFSTVFIAENNCVYFVDSKRSNMLSRTGWIYTAQCTPDPNITEHSEVFDCIEAHPVVLRLAQSCCESVGPRPLRTRTAATRLHRR